MNLHEANVFIVSIIKKKNLTDIVKFEDYKANLTIKYELDIYKLFDSINSDTKKLDTENYKEFVTFVTNLCINELDHKVEFTYDSVVNKINMLIKLNKGFYSFALLKRTLNDILDDVLKKADDILRKV